MTFLGVWFVVVDNHLTGEGRFFLFRQWTLERPCNMDNETALPEFERYLRRRYPERSTAKHYLSDLRQFRKVGSVPVTGT